MKTCQAQKLNPFAQGEAYLIKFGSDPAQMVVGKDAYMRRAEENPAYRGHKSGIVVLRGEQVIQKEGTCLYPVRPSWEAGAESTAPETADLKRRFSKKSP